MGDIRLFNQSGGGEGQETRASDRREHVFKEQNSELPRLTFRPDVDMTLEKTKLLPLSDYDGSLTHTDNPIGNGISPSCKRLVGREM